MSSAELGTGHFRQSMNWLHTWAGLVLGWLLYFMFLTGTLGYFDEEIDRWMKPEIVAVAPTLSHVELVSLGETYLKTHAEGASEWWVGLPTSRDTSLSVSWKTAIDPDTQEGGAWVTQYLDTATGEASDARDTGGGQTLYRMHYALHYMPAVIAYVITSLAAFFMLMALITGIVIHRRIFTDLFTFRPGKRQRSWLDMHNIMSVLPLPFHLMITYSGLVFLMFTTMPGVVQSQYADNSEFFAAVFSEPSHEAAGQSAASLGMGELAAIAGQHWDDVVFAHVGIKHPGDQNAVAEVYKAGFDDILDAPILRINAVSGEILDESKPDRGPAAGVYEVLVHLHEGLFANTGLRWLYFLSGMLGTGMIATGMILWTSKRRQRLGKRGIAGRGLVLVEKLNAGAIAGLLVAVAVYFWANRLLPLDLDGRAAREVDALFVALGLSLFYPLIRTVQRTWIELLGLAAVLFALLPVLNALTTSHNLASSIGNHDWIMASVDFSFVCTGLILAYAATRLWRRQHQSKPAIKSVNRESGERNKSHNAPGDSSYDPSRDASEVTS